MKIHWPLTWKETDGEMARAWVPREHAEAEIGKAIREEGAKFATWNRDHEEAAYKFERERIADMLEREMNAPDSKDHDAEWNRVTRNALRYAITCIRHRRPEEPFCVCPEYFEKHGKHHPNCGCEPKDAQEPDEIHMEEVPTANELLLYKAVKTLQRQVAAIRSGSDMK